MAANVGQQNELTALFAAYNKRIGKLYAKFITQLAQLGYNVEEKVKDEPLFLFDNFPELKERLREILTQYVSENILLTKNGIQAGAALAFAQDAKNLYGMTELNDDALASLRSHAIGAFTSKRLNSPAGLNLSHRVWNYAEQAKSEFEMAMSNVITDGLKLGTSAAELSRLVRDQLKEPDMMYRRYHHTVITKGGAKKDVVRWHRRVIDENGNVRFIEAPLEAVGQGVYRSSYKNTFRLMRSEINMSYHYANNVRWQSEPFVIGIRIWGSPQHPAPDICDDLWGDYPKDFLFGGFHPQCLCAAAAITCSNEEIREYHRRKRAGEDMSNWKPKGVIKDVPEGFKKYVAEHKKQIMGAQERGTLGYVFRDNKKYWRKLFTKEEQEKMGIYVQEKRIKSDADKARIQQQWYEHQRKRAEMLMSKAGVAADTPVMQKRLLALEKAISGKNYDSIKAALAEVQHGISIQQIADARHATRNAQKIQDLWDARRTHNALVFKMGKNVMSVAQKLDYKETSGSWMQLQDLLLQYKLADAEKLAKQLAKQLASINKQAEQLEYVQNAKMHLKSVSIADLQAIDASVANKLAALKMQWGSTNWLKLAEKCDWEAYEFLGKNMKGVQDKFPDTWQISQKAYIVLGQKLKQEPVWQSLQAKVAHLQTAAASHSKAASLLSEIADAAKLVSGKVNILSAQDAVAVAEKHLDTLEKGAAKNAAKAAAKKAEKELIKKAGKLGESQLKLYNKGKLALESEQVDLYNELVEAAKAKDAKAVSETLAKLGIDADGNPVKVHTVPTGPVTFAEIKEAEALQLIADFEKTLNDIADDTLRPIIKDIWTNNLTYEERLVLTKYTETYSYLNEPLRGIRYAGGRTQAEFLQDMPTLTSALSKMEMPANTVVRRGTGNFRIPALGKDLSQLKVGDEFVDGAFLSTAVRVDKGFTETYNLIIVVPKGAHGAYAEPFTYYNGGLNYKKYSSGVNSSLHLWDGSHDASFGIEREWIGQRGSKFRVIGKKGDTIYLQMLGQYHEVVSDPSMYIR